MRKNYEFMIIVAPKLWEEDNKNVLKTLKETIEKFSWKITKEDVWWEKKLAYKINNSDKWYYVLYNLELDWTEIKNISKEINLQKSIWRYMFVCLD